MYITSTYFHQSEQIENINDHDSNPIQLLRIDYQRTAHDLNTPRKKILFKLLLFKEIKNVIKIIIHLIHYCMPVF